MQRFGNPSGSGRWAQNARQVEGVVGGVMGATGGLSGLAPLAALPVIGNLLGQPGVARALVRLSEDRWAGGRLPRWFLRRTMEIARRYPAAEQNLMGMVQTLETGTPANAVTIKGQQTDTRQPVPESGDIDLGTDSQQDGRREPLPDDGFIDLN